MKSCSKCGETGHNALTCARRHARTIPPGVSGKDLEAKAARGPSPRRKVGSHAQVPTKEPAAREMVEKLLVALAPAVTVKLNGREVVALLRLLRGI